MWSFRETPSNNDYLMHYGIEGQKWGVRRFQNADGTLTEEGKLRYSESSGGSDSKNIKIRKQFEKANNACRFDQDVLRNWKENYSSYKNKESKLVEDYQNRYLKDSKIQKIDDQKDQLAKDYFQALKETDLTIGDVLFRRKEAEQYRDTILNGLKKVYKDLDKKRNEESYRIAYDTFKDLPKYERIIAMGVFNPSEGEWRKVRRPNTLVY